MNTSHYYIVIAIAVLLVIAVLVFRRAGDQPVPPLTPLAGIAFALVIAGLFLSQDGVIGFGLLAIGVVLAFFDIHRRSKHK